MTTLKSSSKAYDPSVERKFTQEEVIGICVMCTLSDAMKPCMQGCVCPFSLGLAVRAVHEKTLSLGVVEREEFWMTLPPHLWNAYHDYAFGSYMLQNTK